MNGILVSHWESICIIRSLLWWLWPEVGRQWATWPRDQTKKGHVSEFKFNVWMLNIFKSCFWTNFVNLVPWRKLECCKNVNVNKENINLNVGNQVWVWRNCLRAYSSRLVSSQTQTQLYITPSFYFVLDYSQQCFRQHLCYFPSVLENAKRKWELSSETGGLLHCDFYTTVGVHKCCTLYCSQIWGTW